MRRLCVLAVVTTIALPQVASAAEMFWNFQNNYPYVVDIQLFAPYRNNFWPNYNRVWIHQHGGVMRFGIACIQGEKVCYGASPRGNYHVDWGSGVGNQYSCSSCCYLCIDGQETPIINLDP